MKPFIFENKEIKASELQFKDDVLSFTLEGQNFSFELLGHEAQVLKLKNSKGKIIKLPYSKQGDDFKVYLSDRIVNLKTKAASQGSSTMTGGLDAPMPGKVFKILKSVGESIKAGETILVMEAMKMEHPIKSATDGIVSKIHYKVGDMVQGGSPLAEVKEK